MHNLMTDAWAYYPSVQPAPWLVLTCEHASNRLPSPWTWPPQDQRLVDMHWASDLGAADFTKALAEKLDVPAVLGRFTRLLVDPNRPLDSDTLFRRTADGQPIAFNQRLDTLEKQRRIDSYYQPYHSKVAQVVAASPGAAVIGMHSFTPVYEGQSRQVEIGVLFDHDEASALAFTQALANRGFDVRLNEPWSGQDGLMYGPQHHATSHQRHCLELELRQDLLADSKTFTRLLPLIADAARAVFGPTN